MILQAAAEDAPPRPGATSSQLYAYLSTEVLERQPREIQQFLLRASVLNHLTVALCNTVLEMESADLLLARIQDQQLFLIATGGPGAPAYRLHQLFREFLAARLRAADLQEFARLHGRAATYYEEQGDYGQAMEHLFASDTWGRAAALAARVGPGELDAGRGERVEHWLDHFPAGEEQHWPILLLLQPGC